MECPIGLDKTLCRNCYFWRDGKCACDEIIQEVFEGKAMDNFARLLVSVKRLDRTRLLPFPLPSLATASLYPFFVTSSSNAL